MSNIISVKIGGFLKFDNLGDLDKFCDSQQFKTQNFEYISRNKHTHTIKRIN